MIHAKVNVGHTLLTNIQISPLETSVRFNNSMASHVDVCVFGWMCCMILRPVEIVVSVDSALAKCCCSSCCCWFCSFRCTTWLLFCPLLLLLDVSFALWLRCLAKFISWFFVWWGVSLVVWRVYSKRRWVFQCIWRAQGLNGWGWRSICFMIILGNQATNSDVNGVMIVP